MLPFLDLAMHFLLEDMTQRGSFEYLDHTADIVIHAFADVLPAAFESCGVALYNYMTPTENVKVTDSVVLEASGGTLEELLFNYMNELLFLFGSKQFIGGTISVIAFDKGSKRSQAINTSAEAEEPLPEQAMFIRCVVGGEKWEDGRHKQGTEVKAITKHGIRIGIAEEDMKYHIYLVIDI